MRVQHNIAAMNSYRNYGNNTKIINKNLEKLSSGYKINRAGDDAAGLAISEKMRAQITGLEVAQKNAKDGISLVQTAEGALTEVHSMLNRMFELAEQSANGTYTDKTVDSVNGIDRDQLQKEVVALRTEINRIRNSANFNGQKLFDGTLDGAEIKSDAVGVASVKGEIEDTADKSALANALAGSTLKLDIKFDNDGKNSGSQATLTGATGYTLANADFTGLDEYKGDITFEINKSGTKVGTYTVHLEDAKKGVVEMELGTGNNMQLQIGDTKDYYNQMDVNIADIKDEALGIDTVDIGTVSGAQSAMKSIKDAINKVSNIRGGLGAVQNRLEHTISNLSVMQENMQDAESTIRDTDVAAEMMKYTKNSILVQSAQAMLAQANQQPQGVLQLLQ